MGHGYFGFGGMWFLPMAVVVGIVIIYIKFNRSHLGSSESALELLKKRYAKGEINKKEFEEIKKNLH